VTPAPISVVVPTYERTELCLRAVRSALGQDPPPREVLVCDNASGDETARALAERFAGQGDRVRHLRAPLGTNGPAWGRNLGLDRARSAWVAFLDDDDEWLPGKLAAQLAAAADGVDLVATNALRTSDGTPYLTSPPPHPDHATLLRDNALITSSVLVRRDALRASGGFPQVRRLQGVEDYAAWLTLAAAGARMTVLPAPLVRYRDEGAAKFGAAGEAALGQLVHLYLRHWSRRPTDVARARRAASAAIVARRARRAAR
jgi:glycosyltransferase involved in cell wall biosynthesis